MDEQIAEHLKRLGVDRWSSLRKTIEEHRVAAEERGRREAAMTMRHVLTLMDDAERFEEVATEVKRAELTGDMDGLLQAMARLGQIV